MIEPADDEAGSRGRSGTWPGNAQPNSEALLGDLAAAMLRRARQDARRRGPALVPRIPQPSRARRRRGSPLPEPPSLRAVLIEVLPAPTGDRAGSEALRRRFR